MASGTTTKKRDLPPVEESTALALGLTKEEWDKIVDGLGRKPNEVECALFVALWDENYSYKSSHSFLQLLGRDGAAVVKFPGCRAGVVEIGEGDALVFRMDESNRALTSDAAVGVTCSSSRIFDELISLGVRPIAMVNLLRVGDANMVENHRLLRGALGGLSRFTNRAGVPMVGGELLFHSAFNNAALVNTCALGIAHKNKLPELQKPAIGSPILLAGTATGYDGLTRGKATGPDTGAQVVAPLVGDPLASERLHRAVAEALDARLVKVIVDLEIGGIGTAAFELARRSNTGVRLDLDRVPARIPNLTPREVLTSETPARILVVVNKGEHRRVSDIFERHRVGIVLVGELVDTDDVNIFWHHHQIACVPFSFAREGLVEKEFELAKFPPMLRKASYREGGATTDGKSTRARGGKADEWAMLRNAPMLQKKAKEEGIVPIPDSLDDVWIDLLADPNLCSRHLVYEQFDQLVRGSTLVAGGNDAGVIRFTTQAGAERGVTMTIDCNSLYVKGDPYLGTVQTVAEGMRNLAACGARPVAVAHCMNFGDPARHQDISELSEALRGLADACRAWNIPVLSDRVSLFNGTEVNPILGSPAVCMIGVIDDARHTCSVSFKNAGDRVFLVGSTKDELGCSEYLSYCHHVIAGSVPDIDFELEERTCGAIRRAIAAGLLASCHDLSAGGLALALTECAVSGRPAGVRLSLKQTLADDEFRPDALLFSETSARFLVSCKPEHETELRALLDEAKLPITAEGEVGGKQLRIEGAIDVSIPLSTARRIWHDGLNHLFGVETSERDVSV